MRFHRQNRLVELQEQTQKLGLVELLQMERHQTPKAGGYLALKSLQALECYQSARKQRNLHSLLITAGRQTELGSHEATFMMNIACYDYLQ